MQRILVMTIIGADKPGLVDSLAKLVLDHRGNWLESRLSHLGGQFAGILRVAVPPQEEAALTSALSALPGLKVMVYPDQVADQPADRPARIQLLEIIGQDRPGIVRQISKTLADQGVNVEDFQSECASAAMSGESVFKARVTLTLPESCDVAKLRASLEKIAEDLIVEITLADLPPGTA